jgi:hypothetical protein
MKRGVCISLHWLLPSLPTVSPDAWHLPGYSPSPTHEHFARIGFNEASKDLPAKMSLRYLPVLGWCQGPAAGAFFLQVKTIPFFEPPRGWEERPGSGDNASDTQIYDHRERRVRRGWRTENVAHAGCTSVG